MKKIRFNFVLVFLTIFLSCSKDDSFNDNDQRLNMFAKSSNLRINATLFNGILKFENQTDFDNSIEYIKEKFDENDLNVDFVTFYNQGFEPLYLHSDDDALISRLINKKNDWLPVAYQNSDEFENSDDLIYSDYFASFLNYKRQIIVGDFIYMYTFNGVLKAPFRDYAQLESIVSNNNLNDNLPTTFPEQETQNDLGNGIYLIQPSNVYSGCPGEAAPIIADLQENSHDDVEHIQYHCNDYVGGGSNYPPSSGEVLESTFDNMVQKMRDSEPCSHRSSWVLFGTRRVCSKKLDGRPQRRTRIEFSNVNFLIYEEISLKTKHQRKKSIGIASWWNTQKADEIGLLVNNATFKINHSNYSPQPPTSNFPNQFHSQFFVRDINMTFSYNQGTGPIDPIQSTPLNHDKFKPFTPFNEDVTIQIFGDDFPFIGGEITFESEKLNDYFWDFVYDGAKAVFKSQHTSEPTKFTLIFNTHSETMVQYIDLETRRTNRKKIHKVLDSNWGAVISFNINLYSNGSPIDANSETQNTFPFPVSFKSVDKNLWDYDAINIDFVGYSRKDSNSSHVRMRYLKDE